MVPSLVERHLEEVTFLLGQRALAAEAPHHDLASLGAIDARLEANLDGLVLGGDEASALCRAAADGGRPGVTFAGAFMALARRDRDGLADVLDQAAAPSRAGEVVVALEWARIEDARPALERLLAKGLPVELRRIGLGACAARRLDPGRALDDALAAGDAGLRTVALGAAGVLGAAARVGAVREALGDPRCRAAAAWAGTLLGDPGAEAIYASIALVGTRPGDDAGELAAIVDKDARDLSLLPPRMAMRYVGASGDIRHVPWLLERLEAPELARLAGGALTMITGVDLGRPPLRGSAPAGFAAGPTDDPADSVVAMDPDDDLPWPDAAAVKHWWATAADTFGAGARLLLGRPRTEDWLERVLADGRQRERAVAALALKRARSGRPLFNVRAPALRQKRALTSVA